MSCHMKILPSLKFTPRTSREGGELVEKDGGLFNPTPKIVIPRIMIVPSVFQSLYNTLHLGFSLGDLLQQFYSYKSSPREV